MIKTEVSKNTANQSSETPRFSIERSYTTLDFLGDYPSVSGHEVQELVDKFHSAADNVANDPETEKRLLELLREINPNFEPKSYSELKKADILANVVAAVYAPIIHNFNTALLDNVQRGALPPHIIAPPRDTIPFVNSLQLLASKLGIGVEVFTPYINRNTAGIPNNQTLKPPQESPYLEQHLRELIAHLPPGQSFTEVEPGIYSTLSLKVSSMLKRLGHYDLAALKMYGLGPNLSYIHAVLSDGKEWVAEEAEKKGLVDPKLVAKLMILLDSIEEFGMQDDIASVEELQIGPTGQVEPKIVHNSATAKEIARATNIAVIDTVETYSRHQTEFVQDLLGKVPFLAAVSRELSLPLTLSAIIPPDNREIKEAHFNNIRESGLLHYPQDLKL